MAEAVVELSLEEVEELAAQTSLLNQLLYEAAVILGYDVQEDESIEVDPYFLVDQILEDLYFYHDMRNS